MLEGRIEFSPDERDVLEKEALTGLTKYSWTERRLGISPLG